MRLDLNTQDPMLTSFSQLFFEQPTLELAPQLLGAKLITHAGNKLTSGIIVEVEAYIGNIDEACHAYKRRTKRTEVMYWKGGHCYVYFIYGMHHCVNVVAEAQGKAAAVLIRAVEPLEGIHIMRKRRKVPEGAGLTGAGLTNGPGKLCQAFGINSKHWGEHFLSSKLIRLEPYLNIPAKDIGRSKRIGISKSKNLPWRFFVRGNFAS